MSQLNPNQLWRDLERLACGESSPPQAMVESEDTLSLPSPYCITRLTYTGCATPSSYAPPPSPPPSPLPSSCTPGVARATAARWRRRGGARCGGPRTSTGSPRPRWGTTLFPTCTSSHLVTQSRAFGWEPGMSVNPISSQTQVDKDREVQVQNPLIGCWIFTSLFHPNKTF